MKDFFSEENLHQAYMRCKKGKKKNKNLLLFELYLFENLQNLSKALKTQTYQPSSSICFYLYYPKLREIFAANFKDRVVHQLLIHAIEPIFEKTFIYDSYANRKNKGTHKAVQRLQDFIKKVSSHFKTPAFYLQLDIKGYFNEINKNILKKLLLKRVKDPLLEYLILVFLNHSPVKNFVYHGRYPHKGVLPPHKTLIHEQEHKGIPIGNLTSQFFANVYLNELDQYVKRGLGLAYYIRYMDDFIILHQDFFTLLEIKEKIKTYLHNHLDLQLKDDKVLPCRLEKGINFLGYIIKPSYTLVRKRVVKNCKKSLALLLPQKPSHNFVFYHNLEKWKKFQLVLNSYLNHFSYAKSGGLINKIKEVLTTYQSIGEIKNKVFVLKPKKPYHFKNFPAQVRFFTKQFPSKMLILQVGNTYEIYGGNVLFFQKKLSLDFKTRKDRGGLKGASVGGHKLKKIINICKKQKIPFVFFKQQEGVKNRVCCRYPLLEYG